MVSGWNLWVWLQCIGVAIVGVVIRRYIDILIIIINFPYSTCIRSFFGSSMLTSLFIFKMFFRSLDIYPHNNYQFSLYTPLVLALFLAAASLLLCSFFKCFFGLVYVILLQYINVTQRTFEIVQKKSRLREYNY